MADKCQICNQDDEECQIDCDQCNKEFCTNTPLWPNFQEQADENESLQGILTPSGFPPKWHCSEKCQLEDTQELRAEIERNWQEETS